MWIYAFCPNLEDIMTKSAQVLYPSLRGEERCTLVLVYNLAEPDWINVNCHDQIIPTVLCMKLKQRNDVKVDDNNESLTVTEVCPSETTSINSTCYLFHWSDRFAKYDFRNTIKMNANSSSLPELQTIKNLFQSTSANYPVLLTQSTFNKIKLLKMECTKYFSQHKCAPVQEISQAAASGYLVYSVKYEKIFLGLQVFTCRRGSKVTLYSRCDGAVDCSSDKSDEEKCLHFKNRKTEKLSNVATALFGNKDHCGPLHYTTIKSKCVMYLMNEIVQHSENDIKTRKQFLCGKNYTTNDLVIDWDFNRKQSNNWKLHEEGHLLMLLKGQKYYCSHPMELPCKDGHSKCFNVSQICMFSLNNCDHLIPCRNGGHMEECKYFTCNKHFKCKESYCVPWTFVCDTKLDCPNGEDEAFKCGVSGPTCNNLFKCWKAQSCVHVGSICDGTMDCPLGDDEQMCELRHIQCPVNCECLAFAVSCNIFYPELLHYPFLAVHMNMSHMIREVMHRFSPVLFLQIHHSNVSEKQQLKSLPSLVILDLDHNKYSKIPQNYFSGNRKLKTLTLSKNEIASLSSDSFNNLHMLILISLSDNPITHYPGELFSNSLKLKYLSLENILFVNIDVLAFETIKPRIIASSDHQLCCLKPSGSVCVGKFPWFKSCHNLLETYGIWVACIAVCCINIVVNVSSGIVHMVSRSMSNKTYTTLASVIHCVNLLVSVYLSILWVSETILNDTFAVKQTQWRSGTTCFAVFGVFLFFMISSHGYTILLSLSRLMVVEQPISSSFKRVTYVVKVTLFTFLFYFVLSLKITLAIEFTYQQVPTKFCVPLFNPPQWVLPTVILAVLNLCDVLSFILVTIMHAAIVLSTLASAANLKKSSNKKDVGLVVQLLLLSVSALCSWLPSNIISTTVIFLRPYPLELIPWTIVSVIPLNALAAPVILASFALKRLME